MKTSKRLLASEAGRRGKQGRPGRAALPCLVLALGLSACREADRSGVDPAHEGHPAQQTHTPAAPQEQPHYGQVGSGVSSQVTTNVAGERGLAGEPPPEKDTDETLAQRVHVALSVGTTGTTGIYTPDMLIDIEVVATNGVVTLRGDVGSESAGQALAQRARSMTGVRGVNNELRVSDAIPGHGPLPGVPSGRGQQEVVPQAVPGRGIE